MPYPNWFAHYAAGFFARHLSDLAGKPDLRFLQVGAFTGDASLWLLDNVLTGPNSILTDVDTWAGSDEAEHEPFDWSDVEACYDVRTSVARRDGRLVKHKGTSSEFFDSGPQPFDFVYIDGDHTAPAVLSDTVRSFDRLILGGLIGFDDYLWKHHDRRETHSPGIAVDAFVGCYADRLEVLEVGLQVWVRKIA